MRANGIMYFGRVLGIAALLAAFVAVLSAWPVTGQAVLIDDDDLGGVVTGANGP